MFTLFRKISLPFFKIFDFLYLLVFGVKPVGEGIFTTEKNPCKYSGPVQRFPGGVEIRRGDRVMALHLKKDNIMYKEFRKGLGPREKILEIVEFSLKELARFSIQNKDDFAAFWGKTPVRFFKMRNYGFAITPLEGKISDLIASLQSFFIRENCHTLPKRKFYQYLIPRKTLEERFGNEN